jgi:NAD(P)-dependent dehydrogenase (short-subunit alcohol dehydrogenase family)
VYVTGRSTRDAPKHGEPDWSVDAAADAVTRLGGEGVAVRCDHGDDAQVAALFDRVASDRGRLDILVNNAVGGDMAAADLHRNQFGGVWRADVAHWDNNMTVGVRSSFVATRFGLPLMMGHPSLVVFTSEWPNVEARHPDALADLRAHATSRIAFTFAKQLLDHQVASVCLVPGDVLTHARRRNNDAPFEAHEESVFYAGRAVATLAADPSAIELTGQTIRVDDCAARYGFTDVSGHRPDPHAIT